jgi:hypothetical protein
LGKCFAIVLLVIMLAAREGAQSPPLWTVTVTPTLNPLPIGFCAAVQLTLRDASRGTEPPRNPLGGRVTIADFDMTVTTPEGSVAGQRVDADHWSACGCQSAVVGTVATVTATYPAQSLPAASRVPGVAFQTRSTFTLAAAKNASNPPACTMPSTARVTAAAPPPIVRPVVPSASAPPPVIPIGASAAPPTSSKAPASAAVVATPPPAAPTSSNPPPASSRPAAPPSTAPNAADEIAAQITGLPDGTAGWAALQKALGSSGWAELQKAVDAFMNEQSEPTDDKPPPGVPALLPGGRNHPAAVAAFMEMVPVLRHPRCVGCHSDMSFFDGDDDYVGDGSRDSKGDFLRIPGSGAQATHPGGALDLIPESPANRTGITLCNECHTKAPPQWAANGPRFEGLNDYALCGVMKRARNDGAQFLEHVRDDALVKLAFQGQRAMDEKPEPPPLSHAQFVRAATDWIGHMDAMKKYPKALSEGCPRNEAWSGAVEYTYTEATKRDKSESHGMVHFVDGHGKWSGLAARVEDHSAKGCPSVYSASSSGGGKTELVTIDHTSTKPVTGFTLPNTKQTPNAMLTIFPDKYAFLIELPLKGSGKYNGGGPACPGYNDHPIVQPFDITISDNADGKFDLDNPDEISGTKTTSPFPGASLTMKWRFVRVNEDR